MRESFQKITFSLYEAVLCPTTLLGQIVFQIKVLLTLWTSCYYWPTNKET